MKLILSSVYSVGIIGGADGPTSIFVAAPDNRERFVVIAAVILIAATALMIRKKRKK